MYLSLDYNAIYNNIEHIEEEYGELKAVKEIMDEMYPFFFETGNMHMYSSLSEQIKTLERSVKGRIEILSELVDDFRRINNQNSNEIQDMAITLKRIIDEL